MLSFLFVSKNVLFFSIYKKFINDNLKKAAQYVIFSLKRYRKFLIWRKQMAINILVCDDDESCVDTVIGYLHDYEIEYGFEFCIDKFTKSVEAASVEKFYHIAFLDVEMGDVSGLDVAKKLKESNEKIIMFFITNYEKYIDDAMDLFALRFLKKPIDRARFFNGLNKAIELINEDTLNFYAKDLHQIKKIKARDIVYIEIGNRKTVIATKDRTYYSTEPIEHWGSALTNVCFARPHKSFIVNMEYITKYQRTEIELADTKTISIAYRRQTEFRRDFLEYLKRRKQ